MSGHRARFRFPSISRLTSIQIILSGLNIMADSPEAPQGVLWRPAQGWFQDDYAGEPPLFKLCDICRNLLASPEPSPVDGFSRFPSDVQLCVGSSQTTQCSLRAMLLEHFNCNVQDGQPVLEDDTPGHLLMVDHCPDPRSKRLFLEIYPTEKFLQHTPRARLQVQAQRRELFKKSQY